MSVVQLTDTHITAQPSPGGTGTDGRLRRAIDALPRLGIEPDYIIVTGDLVDRGEEAEYARFAEIMRAAPVPYYVIPGNHDDPDAMRRVLPPARWSVRDGKDRRESDDAPIRYAVDRGALRTIALDVTRERPAPGARIDDETFAWLDARLAERPDAPTLIAVHQPPFRTGLHYLDVFGFAGARKLRERVERNANVGRVVCGHVHCVKRATWGHAIAASAPSTGRMFVPELFERHPLWLRFERPGFAVHDWTPDAGFRTTYYRNDVGTEIWRAEPLVSERPALAAR